MATPQQIASPGVYVSDDTGLEVTDGTASRVQLGKLASGQYGLQVTGANLAGEVSASPPAINLGTPGAQLTDKGLAVSDGVAERVTLGQISPGQYGLRVVSSDGSTVIIDGTSDMFKIAATGTLTRAFPAAGSTATANVTVTGIGTFTVPPAFLSLTGYDNSSTSNLRTNGPAVLTVAGTGAPVARVSCVITLDGSGNAVISLTADNSPGSLATTTMTRYYILIEAGI